MATIKSYTDIEQSKKLAEIMPLESADMHYYYDLDFNELESIPSVTEENDHYVLFPQDVRCWSLAALMNLLPSQFTEVGKYATTTYKIKIRKYKLTDKVDLHQIAYGRYKWYKYGGYTWSDMINTGEKENLIDAAFEMVVWLKENNKL